jgi:alkylation response protein AidB-like acyl-CoA dehydrogenase
LTPGGGSDVASLKTTAVRKGDDLIINGQKVNHLMSIVAE